jgi:hypothetical protein
MSFVVSSRICLNNIGFQAYASTRSLATFLEFGLDEYSENEERKQSRQNYTVLRARTLHPSPRLAVTILKLLWERNDRKTRTLT